MHQRSFRGDHVMILVPITNLARMAVDAGDTATGADWAEQAVAMADRLYAQAAHPYQINALAALAEARIAQGRIIDAVQPAARIQSLLGMVESVPESTRTLALDAVAHVCASVSAPEGLDCGAD